MVTCGRCCLVCILDFFGNEFYTKYFAMRLILPGDVNGSVPPVCLLPRQSKGSGQAGGDLPSSHCETLWGKQDQLVTRAEPSTYPPLLSLPPCSTFGRLSEKLCVGTRVSALAHNSVIEAQTCFFPPRLVNHVPLMGLHQRKGQPLPHYGTTWTK